MNTASTATDRQRFAALLQTRCDVTNTLRGNPYSALILAIIKQGLKDLRDNKTSTLEHDRWLAWFLGSAELEKSDSERIELTFWDCTAFLGIDHRSAQNVVEEAIHLKLSVMTNGRMQRRAQR